MRLFRSTLVFSVAALSSGAPGFADLVVDLEPPLQVASSDVDGSFVIAPIRRLEVVARRMAAAGEIVGMRGANAWARKDRISVFLADFWSPDEVSAARLLADRRLGDTPGSDRRPAFLDHLAADELLAKILDTPNDLEKMVVVYNPGSAAGSFWQDGDDRLATILLCSWALFMATISWVLLRPRH